MSLSRLPLTGLLVIAALLLLIYFLGQRDNLNDTELTAPSLNSANIHHAAPPAPTPAEFPAAGLRSVLTEVCAGDVAKSADKEWVAEEIQAQIDAFNEQKLSLSDSLSASSSAEHLHLAALLENDPRLRIELLDRAISGNRDDAFLLWSAVHICSEIDEQAMCPLRDWERRLIAVDGQNSESRVRIAANHYAAGEYDKALEAMRYASTAAESRAYWTETIEIIERGLAAGSDYAFPERAGMAVGVAASKQPRYGDYVTMCKEQSAKNVDWAYACLAYGELVENQSKTETGVAIAQSIQKLALEALREWEKAAEVEERLQARRQERMDLIGDYDAVTERLIFSNPTLFYSYLAAIRSKGEVAARRKIAVEIERLIEQQPDLACEQLRVR